MERLDTRRRRLPAWRRPSPKGGSPPTDPGLAPGPIGMLAMSAWFGLATGFAELGVLLARNALYGAAVLGSLQVNRHFAWMIPTCDLLAFAAPGVLLAMLATLRARLAGKIAAVVLPALALWTLLLTVRGLHAGASALLALGIAARLAPRLSRHAAGLRRGVRVGLPAMLAVLALVAWRTYDRETLAEGRALRALPAARPGAPNVLLIVMDTVRADSTTLHGYARDTMPNLARLAAGGVAFDEARAAAPWTLPSHASLFTGRWPHELGVGEDRPLSSKYPTLAGVLATHGYATAGFIANTYYCNAWYGLGRGFAHYEDYYENNRAVSAVEVLRSAELGRRLVRLAGASANLRLGDTNVRKDAARINRALLDWLDRRPANRPFFAFLNYLDAHDPYLVPEGATRRFGLVPQSPADVALIRGWDAAPKRDLSPRDVQLVRDAYDDCIAYLDGQIGTLLDALGRRGLLEDTLVVVTSDHGEELGEHGLFGHGRSLYRPELHVPLVLSGPGVPPGRRVGGPASLRDVPATILDRVGLAGVAPIPGRSLAAAWDAAGGSGGGPVFSEVALRETISKNRARPPAMRGPMQAVVEGGRTTIRNADGTLEHYDLRDDPGEARDLADDPASRPRLERGRAALERFRSVGSTD